MPSAIQYVADLRSSYLIFAVQRPLPPPRQQTSSVSQRSSRGNKPTCSGPRPRWAGCFTLSGAFVPAVMSSAPVVAQLVLLPPCAFTVAAEG